MKKAIASLLSIALAMPSWAAIPVSNYTWSAASELTSAQEGSGATTQYDYNGYGELVQETWPTGFGGVSYGRNLQGALTSVQDPRGLTTSYTRNGFADVSQQTSPDTGTETFAQDAAGNVTSKGLPNGGSVAYTYDAANRITSTNSGDESATYAYDEGTLGKGRLTSMQDNSGATSWSYDGVGNVLSKSQTVNGTPLTVSYGYSAGRLSQITYPSGAVVSFGFDAERVTSISVNGVPAITGVEYAPFGPATSWQMGSAGTYARSFDTAGRVASYTFENGTRQLDWDASNRLTSVQNPDGSTWTYGYDDLNRIVSANEGSQGSRSYGLDAVGNRTSLTQDGTAYSYGVDGSSNRLTSATGPAQTQSFQYDNAGRVTSDGTRFYTWTNAGRLASATVGATSTAYTYNGFGQRVQKAGGADVRQYLYAEDGTTLLGEYPVQGGTGASAVEVVYLGGTPVLALTGGQVYFIQADHLNAPRTIKNAAGAVVWRWHSDAFGVGAADSNPSGLAEFAFNLRFPGQLFDAETGLHYNNARYYDPSTGRYISSDPIGLAGGINTYGYVGQAPTGAVDPTGNNAIVWGARGGAAAGTVVWPGVGTVVGAALGAAGAYAIGVGLSQWALPAQQRTGIQDVAPPSCQGITPVYVDSGKYPEVAAHIEAAIAAGHPSILTVDKPGAEARRKASMAFAGMHPMPLNDKIDRDEYPMAMFIEGGLGASVRYLDAGQNRGAGKSVALQCAAVPTGCKVEIHIK